MLKVLEAASAFRHPERLEQFLLACEADARGRTGLEDRAYPQPQRFRRAASAAREIVAQPFLEQGLTGPAVGEAITQARISAIAAADRAATIAS